MKNIFKIIGSILIIFIVAAFAGEKVFFYHTDAAGTPLAITDEGGNVVWRADYKPFGEEEEVTGSHENQKRFIGKEKDKETGLYYFGARYMDAGIGRFIAPDSVSAVDPGTSKTNESLLLNPQKINRYSYGLNNPYRYVDVEGKNIWDLMDIGFFAYDLYKFYKDPSWSKAGDLGLDTIGLLPLVPSVGSIKFIGKGVERVEEATKGSKLLWGTWNDYSKVIIGGQEYAKIGERLYTRHAVERMMPVGLGGRGVPPTVVENAIQFGTKTEGKFGRTIHTFENVRVITEKDIVISVIKIGK
jgi:RHS repeat-associated protein